MDASVTEKLENQLQQERVKLAEKEKEAKGLLAFIARIDKETKQAKAKEAEEAKRGLANLNAQLAAFEDKLKTKEQDMRSFAEVMNRKVSQLAMEKEKAIEESARLKGKMRNGQQIGNNGGQEGRGLVSELQDRIDEMSRVLEGKEVTLRQMELLFAKKDEENRRAEERLREQLEAAMKEQVRVVEEGFKKIIDDSQEELEMANEALGRRREEIAKLKHDLQEEREKGRVEASGLRESLVARDKEAEELRAMLAAKGRGDEASLLQRVQSKEDELRDERGKYQELAAEFAAYKQESQRDAEEVQKRLKGAEGETSRLRHDLAEAVAEIQGLVVVAAQSEQALAQITQRLEEKTAEAGDLERTRVAMEAQLAKAANEKESLEKEFRDTTEALRQAREEELQELYRKMQEVSEGRGEFASEEDVRVIKEQSEKERKERESRWQEEVKARDEKIKALEGRVAADEDQIKQLHHSLEEKQKDVMAWQQESLQHQEVVCCIILIPTTVSL